MAALDPTVSRFCICMDHWVRQLEHVLGTRTIKDQNKRSFKIVVVSRHNEKNNDSTTATPV